MFTVTNQPDLRIDIPALRYPIFGLTAGRKETVTWIDPSSTSSVSIEIESTSVGRPTVIDRDVVTFCQTWLCNRFARETFAAMAAPPEVVFTAREFAEATCREFGGNTIKYLETALRRLCSVTIISKNIIVDGVELAESGDHVIDRYEITNKKNRQSGRGHNIEITVQLSRWTWRALIKNFLIVDPIFYTIRNPLARRLAEIARVTLGNQKSARLDLERLLALIGAKTPKHKLLPMIIAQLPELERLSIRAELSKRSIVFEPIIPTRTDLDGPPPIDDDHLLIPIPPEETLEADLAAVQQAQAPAGFEFDDDEDFYDCCPQDIIDMRRAALTKMDQTAVS